jgi:dipeptidyl aminopeptidase/acylaminoacyl peptidase
MSSVPLLRTIRALVAVTLLAAALPAVAQTAASASGTGSPMASPPADPTTKKVLQIDDFSKWRAIDAAQISNDGKWVAYGTRFTNVVTPDAKPVLTLLNLETNEKVEVADATNAQFSADSRWIVYQLEIPAGARRDSTADSTARARPAPGGQPTRRTELRELATGKIQDWQDIQSATFSPTSTHLLLRRRPPTAGNGAAAPAAPAGGASAVRGTDALLVTLATSRTQFLGSVGTVEFNRPGGLLAYTVEATVKDGNGLFVVELGSGRTIALENDDRTYNRLSWNDAGTALAVLKGKEVPRMREREQVLVVYPNVASAVSASSPASPVTLDPATAEGFPKGWVISDIATLSWSDDGRRVFFGAKAQVPAADTGRRRSTDSVPDVDVWRTNDERIQSLQMIRANADRNFTYRQAFDVPAARFVLLADTTMRELDVAPDGRWAVGRDVRGYIADFGRPRADFYRVNTVTGERTLMMKGAPGGQNALGFSADGRHWLYWKDAKLHDYDLDIGTMRAIGANGAPSFVNEQYDSPGEKPSYGIAGFSKDGRGVIAQTRYDLWYVPYVPTAASRSLTEDGGRRMEVQHRLARVTQADPMLPRAERDPRVVDLSKPVMLSTYGEWTKKAGFSELNGNRVATIVFEDASFNTPVKALKADRYLLTRQTFREFPDLRIADRSLATSRKITDVNPQQAEYAWGRRVLFDFTLKDGTRSQGILALPDDYKEGEKRPMIVTFYEKNSQGMHRYPTPSLVTGMGSIPTSAVSKGYITMLPDVYFRTGQSHLDMLEAVEAATRKVIELGYADPARIGVHGHSYGGEGAAFIATQSKLFAAVGMGAGVTDLFSDFSQSWGWSYQVNDGSGQNAYSYYLEGQGRWGFSPWDKPEVYRFESALTHAPSVSMPVLIMHGTADPTVSFQEGMNFYQALRYLKKDAIMLAYPNEGHGLRGMANRKDLTIRYFQFFDHHLRGAPAPAWMREGVPYLDKERLKDPLKP